MQGGIHMSSKWITVDEAAAILKVSTSTVRRRVESGKIESKLEDGRRLVWVSDDTQMSSSDKLLITELHTQNEHLRNQIENLQEQVVENQRSSDDASQRHDTIVLQLTRQLEQSQRMLEAHREPWYRRMFKKGRESGEKR